MITQEIILYIQTSGGTLYLRALQMWNMSTVTATGLHLFKFGKLCQHWECEAEKLAH